MVLIKKIYNPQISNVIFNEGIKIFKLFSEKIFFFISNQSQYKSSWKLYVSFGINKFESFKSICDNKKFKITFVSNWIDFLGYLSFLTIYNQIN